MARRKWVESQRGELFLTASFDEALAGLYPEHYDLSLDSPDGGSAKRQEQRETIADRVATEVQGLTLAAMADDGTFNPDEEDEETLTALSSRPALTLRPCSRGTGGRGTGCP